MIACLSVCASVRVSAEGDDYQNTTDDVYQNTTDGEYGTSDGEQNTQKKAKPPIDKILPGLIQILPYITATPEQAPPRPDLSLASAAAKFDEAARRAALSFCVLNTSKAKSPQTTVSIRDRATGEVVGTVPLDPLGPGKRACRDGIRAAVPAAGSDTRTYDLTVDPDNAIKESNESNNGGSATIAIAQQIDLALADAAAKFDIAARRVALSFCVVNRSTSAASKTEVEIRDRLTGGSVAKTGVGQVAAGGRACRGGVTVAVPTGFSGARQYDFTVDPDNRIGESDENNNRAVAAVSIREQPDLALAKTAAMFDAAAQRAALSFCVVNRSKIPVKQAKVSIRDRATGETVASPTVASIGAGASVCRKDVFAPVPAGFNGTRRYDLEVDSENRISESDESNNTSVAAVDVSAQPDLAFTDTAAKFDAVAREMVLSFCVINRGDTASGETRVSIRDPSTNAEIGSPRIAPLEAGRRTCRDGLLMPVAAGFVGARKYELAVDPDGAIAESDENNNAAQAEAEVTGQPNLGFAESSGTFDEAARRAALSFCVVNSGQASSGEAGLSIQSAGNLTVGALSTGGRACFNDIEVPVPAEYSGTRQYALTVDPQNAIAESDESDNTRTVSLVVPEAASPIDKALETAREILQSRAAQVVLVTIVASLVLAGGIVLVLFWARRPKRVRAPVPSESIEFRARPDPGAQIARGASPDIVLPRLQLRGHVDPGHQTVEMMRTAAE